MDIFQIMEKLSKTTKALVLMLLVVTVPFFLIQVSKEAFVGVKVGDWAKYNVIVEWSSEDPNATMSASWQNLNNTQWENVTVQKISGTNITIRVTATFINVTQKDFIYWGDITTNRGSDEFGFQIIPAGLDQGDVVRQSLISINYTESKQFAGQNRRVNFADVSLQREGLIIYEYRWDKETGILCASILTDTFLNSTSGYRTLTQLQKTLIETNLWQAQAGSPQETSQNWTQWGVPLVAASIVLVAFLLIKTRPKPKRKRRKRV